MSKVKLGKDLRQVEVRKLLVEGKTQRFIADELDVSLKTINKDCQEIKLEMKKEKKSRKDELSNKKMIDIMRSLGDKNRYEGVCPKGVLQGVFTNFMTELEDRIPTMSNDELFSFVTTVMRENNS